MVIATAYALYNHEIIASKIVDILKHLNNNHCDIIEMIRSTHNYIDFEDHIIRKGAIRAYKGEKMVIPFNMRDGLAICEGKSNEDWNCTAPHGCGRVCSRSKIRRLLNAEDFKKDMEANGIYTTTANESTLDEAPQAYKPYEEILRLIKPSVDILYHIKPLINIKATD